VRKKQMAVEVTAISPITKAEREALNVEAERYGRFLNMPVVVTVARARTPARARTTPLR
jgi:hypothetical protein